MPASRASLYEHAADCFERAGYLAKAAECREQAGLLASAARLYEQTGDIAAAARCYRRGSSTADAVRCYQALNLPQEAAACWEEYGDLLRAAFVLAVQSGRDQQALWLATEIEPRTAEERLRQRVVLTLCLALRADDFRPFEDAIADIELALPGMPPRDRVEVEDWAVQAADALGRCDLSARVLAAAHRARSPRSSARWTQWAGRALGGTTGIPVTVPSASEA